MLNLEIKNYGQREEPKIGSVSAPLPGHKKTLWKPKYNVYMTVPMLSSFITHVWAFTKLFLGLFDWMVLELKRYYSIDFSAM